MPEELVVFGMLEDKQREDFFAFLLHPVLQRSSRFTLVRGRTQLVFQAMARKEPQFG